MTTVRRQAINEGLERLFDFGFSADPPHTRNARFSEHGPMVVETLSTLGRHEAIASWIDGYRRIYDHPKAPEPKQPINGAEESEWRGALGDQDRTTDWYLFFREKLTADSWIDVLKTWVPRLIAGYGGHLTHGLVRTAHAVRALPPDEAPNALELDELARGLGYWASSYHIIGGGRKSSSLETLVPDLAEDIVEFAEAPNADVAISRHTAIFSQILCAQIQTQAIYVVQIVHCITAATAMRNLLPYFPAEFGMIACGHIHQVSTAILARVVRGPIKVGRVDNKSISMSAEALVDSAVKHQDAHVIKLTEACLREDRIRPSPAYRAAAEALLKKFQPWQAWSTTEASGVL
jgi:hypothetical protein